MQYKSIQNTEKAKTLETFYTYVITCSPDRYGKKMIKGSKLKEDLKKLMGAEIESVNRANYYSKGFIKLYVKTKTRVEWLNE
jgi:hypothetical protein